MDAYGIDQQKLGLHPERVADWLRGGLDWETAKGIYPLYVEVSPHGGCNHRCTFCALDYMGYAPTTLEAGLLAERLAEMAALGVKSVMFAGEGEPLLARGITDVCRAAKRAGLDCSFTTNGVFLDETRQQALLPEASWIKVSCNAGTAETYAAVHRTKARDFDRVTANLARAVAYKRAQGLACTIGVQMLLLPENMDEAETLARLCRDVIGADYLVLKPHSQHHLSLDQRYRDLDYTPRVAELSAMAEALSTPACRILFRAEAVSRAAKAKGYARCQATPFFWAYVASSGDVYSCSAFLGDARFRLGNIREQSFREIWEGEGRRRNLELLRERLDIGECRLNCRMDPANLYLWRLRHPQPHDNFI